MGSKVTPIKFLILNPWVGRTGPNTFLCSLVPKLIEVNYQLTILYPLQDDVSSQLEEYGCEVIHLPFLERYNVRNPILKVISRLFDEISLSRKLYTSSCELFDYCLINTEIFSFSLAFLPKIPTLLVVHSLSFSYNTILSRLVFKQQQRFVSKYLAVSNAVKVELINIGITKPIEVVHNGISEGFFYNSHQTKKPSSIFNIICVLYPVHYKGAHLLIEVLRILKSKGAKFKCKVIGWYSKPFDSNYMKEISNAIRAHELGSYITFHPATSDIKNELLSADMLLHPSLSESFGYILAEAMALELPVIAFKIGGIPEIIQNRISGILIEPYNCQEMAHATLELIDDQELRLSLGTRGRERIFTSFNASDKVNQVIKIVNSLSLNSQNI